MLAAVFDSDCAFAQARRGSSRVTWAGKGLPAGYDRLITHGFRALRAARTIFNRASGQQGSRKNML